MQTGAPNVLLASTNSKLSAFRHDTRRNLSSSFHKDADTLWMFSAARDHPMREDKGAIASVQFAGPAAVSESIPLATFKSGSIPRVSAVLSINQHAEPTSHPIQPMINPYRFANMAKPSTHSDRLQRGTTSSTFASGLDDTVRYRKAYRYKTSSTSKHGKSSPYQRVDVDTTAVAARGAAQQAFAQNKSIVGSAGNGEVGQATPAINGGKAPRDSPYRERMFNGDRDAATRLVGKALRYLGDRSQPILGNDPDLQRIWRSGMTSRNLQSLISMVPAFKHMTGVGVAIRVIYQIIKGMTGP